MFTLIIIGAQDTFKYSEVRHKLLVLLQNKVRNREYIVLRSIGDEYVERFASEFGFPISTYSADWGLYKNKALSVRNKALFKDADAIVYFNSQKKELEVIYQQAVNTKLATRYITL